MVSECLGNSTAFDVDGHGSSGYMGELEPCMGFAYFAFHWNCKAKGLFMGRLVEGGFGAFDIDLLGGKYFCPTIRIFSKHPFGVARLVEPRSLEMAIGR
jgi:hypothetical protein